MSNEQDYIAPGTILAGRYEIEGVLGAGGMGAVYKAVYKEIGRRVAIKLLHSQFTGDASVVERFRREARAAGAIGHDNICEVTDVGVTDNGDPFLVMPCLEGGSLAELMSNGRISISRLCDMICQTLGALQAAHDVGIVHRDLKPDNIFVTRVGDRADFIKLLDFGISKILDQNSVSDLTQTGTILGTPHYMAPEQARGAKGINHLVDVYAMGVIMYEALTGERPFIGDSYNEVMFKILTEPFTAPSKLNPSVPPSIEKVVLKAMSRDPAKRYSNCAEMRIALEDASTNTGQQVGVLTAAATAVGDASGPFTPTSGVVPVSNEKTPSPFSSNTNDRVPSTIEAQSAALGEPRKRVALAVGIIIGAIAIVVVGLILLGAAEEAKPPVIVPVSAPVQEDKMPAPVEEEKSPVKPMLPPPVEAEESKPAKKVAASQESPAPPKESAPKRSSVKKKRRSKTTDKPSIAKKTAKKNDVKGRFGTSFATDYED
jgi:eukaryotic-like serine/threonine-protein kinase